VNFRRKTARTYLTKKETIAPGNKVAKGILTLLLGGKKQVIFKLNP
jgi:hypothetical protein